jgi:hypothetical protein
MWGLANRTTSCVFACLAALGAAGVAGLTAGFQARPALSPEPARVALEITASEVVDLRFPADWHVAGAAAPVLAFASADGEITLFDPNPVYSLGHAKPLPPTPEVTVAPKSAPEVTVNPKPVVQAAVKPAPVHRPVHRSNAVLSDSQIASIKRRLNLSPDQERYWPAVEAQLRKMEYKKDAKDAADKPSAKSVRLASVDMSKVDVEGLKTAGFPLVMSFSDDQRRELKSLAHLLGLESVISGF